MKRISRADAWPRWAVCVGAAVLLSSLAPHTAMTKTTADQADVGALDNLQELSHRVSVKFLSPDIVLATVVRDFAARNRAFPVRLDRQFVLPEHSVVTSFALRTGPAWRQARLVTEQRPRSATRARVSGEPFALLRLDGPRSARVVTPEFHAADLIEVRYTVWSRAVIEGGTVRWRFCDDERGKPPEVNVPSSSNSENLRVAPDPQRPECVALAAKRPADAAPLARFAAYRLNESAWWWRLEFSVPEKLTPLALRPSPESVVFVLDGSRSQEERGGLTTQLAIIRAYLLADPNVEVELIVTDRTAKRVFGRFVGAAGFEDALPPMLTTQRLRNGSFVDRGTELAAAAISSTGRPGRIVIMTDGQVRSTLSAASLLAIVRRSAPATAVFMIDPFQGARVDVTLQTADGLSALPAELGGASFRVTVGPSPGPDGDLPRALRQLMAPDRVEKLSLRDLSVGVQPEWPLASASPIVWSNRAFAGEVNVWSGLSNTPPPSKLELKGWVWGREQKFPVRIDRALASYMARLATSDERVFTCAESSRLQQDGLKGGFLGPGLSFAVEGVGWTPEFAGGTSYQERCVEPTVLSPLPRPPPPAQIAKDQFPLTQSAAACHVAIASGTGDCQLRIETWGPEIVDVVVTGGDPQSRDCLEERLWQLALPSDFNARQGRRIDYTFALRRL